ncbi:hypothetical protein LUX73_27055 [Actinomadura madurae]|nr:hypothetical protein [Actinomadura madurae]
MSSPATGATPRTSPAAPGKPDPRTLAAASADRLVAAKPATFKTAPKDRIVRRGVVSGLRGLQHVSYERTYDGLPVYGGDFVVTTNARRRRAEHVRRPDHEAGRVDQGDGDRSTGRRDLAVPRVHGREHVHAPPDRDRRGLRTARLRDRRHRHPQEGPHEAARVRGREDRQGRRDLRRGPGRGRRPEPLPRHRRPQHRRDVHERPAALRRPVRRPERLHLHRR